MGLRFLSLFSGIEAASVAWSALGWECVGVAEIDPFPCAVLRHHYPNVPNLGSVTDITADKLEGLGRVDVVVGGSPCQDLSVAGKRAGLSGQRSGLFHEQLRIFHAARDVCGARFLVWENVPGAFSSNGGGDFAVVVGQMAGLDLAVPEEGWGNEGVAVGKNGLVEWCVLDAQWFGVAQRRRRVFAVLDAGDWANRPPILSQPDSLRGDTAPSRKAGQNAAAGAGAGAASGFDFQNTALTGAITGTLDAEGQSRKNRGHGIVQPYAVANCLTQRMHKGINTTLDEVQTPVLAHALRGEGFDASEDGTQSVASLTDLSSSLRARIPSGVENSTTTAVMQPVTYDLFNVTAPVNRQNRQPGDPCHTLARSNAEHAAVVGAQSIAWDEELNASFEQAGTLLRGGAGGRHDGVAVPIAFHPTQDPISSENVCHSISSGNGQGCATAAVSLQDVRAMNKAQNGRGWNADGTAYTVDTHATQGVATAMQVRRLTPVECERLQGFPDNYTAIPWRGKLADQCPDGPRYKALGNSMAVPVMQWIGSQLSKAAMPPGMTDGR